MLFNLILRILFVPSNCQSQDRYMLLALFFINSKKSQLSRLQERTEINVILPRVKNPGPLAHHDCFSFSDTSVYSLTQSPLQGSTMHTSFAYIQKQITFRCANRIAHTLILKKIDQCSVLQHHQYHWQV